MQTWHWHPSETSETSESYLTCTLLKDWAHGFFTKQFWSRPPEALVVMLLDTTRPPVYRLKQVHGNRVMRTADLVPVEVMPIESEAVSLTEADGLVSTAASEAIWVCSADCTPILVGDLATGQTAAIHAGWRGTAAKILPVAIAQMQAAGSQIADLRVAMGPAIAGDQYQVSETVAAQVGATLFAEAEGLQPAESPDSASVSPQVAEFCQRLLQLPDSPVLPDPQPGRMRLDVPKVNALQLAQLGFEPDQIAIAPYCTYQNPDLFFPTGAKSRKKCSGQES